MTYKISKARYMALQPQEYAGRAGGLFSPEQIIEHQQRDPEWEGKHWVMLGTSGGISLMMCNVIDGPVPNDRFSVGDMVTFTMDHPGFYGRAGKVTAVDGDQITVDVRRRGYEPVTVNDKYLVPLDPSRLWEGERVLATRGGFAGEEGTVISTRNRDGECLVLFDSVPNLRGDRDASVMMFRAELKRLDA